MPFAATPPATVATVVAATRISFGDRLSADKLKVVQLPPGAVPDGAFHATAAITGDGSHIALRPIAANEILVPAAISGRGNRLSTMGLIGPSMRAVSLTVTEPTGVAGLIAPGDRVDVYITRTPPDRPARSVGSLGRSIQSGGPGTVPAAVAPMVSAGPAASSTHMIPAVGPAASSFTGPSASRSDAAKSTPITDILVQGVRVLAIGQNMNVGTEKPEVVKTATLEVTPVQVAKLTLGQSVGTLTLALRPLADEAPTAVALLRVDDLHDGSPRAVHVTRAVRATRAAPRRVQPMIEIVRGGEKEKSSSTFYPVAGL